MPNSLPKFAFPLLVVIVLALAATSIYFYRQYNTLQTNPQAIAQAEAKDLSEEVGKLIVLPADEIPTVATVSDPTALASQAFFAEAKKGDKVLIYTNAKRAILYDPVARKIVNVAPVNIGDGQKPAAKPAAKPSSPSSSTPASGN